MRRRRANVRGDENAGFVGKRLEIGECAQEAGVS